MILSQVRAYSTINEKLNKDLQLEHKNKNDILEAMKEKIEHYKSDLAKAISRSNSYKAKTETAEQKLNELLINYQKIEEQTKSFQLNIQQKDEDIERFNFELLQIREKNKNVNFEFKNYFLKIIKYYCIFIDNRKV